MAITPGDQFEPPYVGSYNQRVHGEGGVRGNRAIENPRPDVIHRNSLPAIPPKTSKHHYCASLPDQTTNHRAKRVRQPRNQRRRMGLRRGTWAITGPASS